MITQDNIKKIWLTDEAIFIETNEGRVSQENFSDYPRLRYATKEQRENYEANPLGIHWEELDEDLSFEGLFKEKPEPTEIGKVFSQLGELNISAFARRLGISQPLMAAYLSGTKTPSEERKKHIEKELHNFGQQLLQVNLYPPPIIW